MTPREAEQQQSEPRRAFTVDDVKALARMAGDCMLADILNAYAASLTPPTPAKAVDLGPHPKCPRCNGSGEADNAQFSCSCRWSTSPLRLTAENAAHRELLRSAHAIAVRKGADTAWERLAASIQALGIGYVTARVYRILPSDMEEAGETQERIADADAEVERLARKVATLTAENERLKGEAQDTDAETLEVVTRLQGHWEALKAYHYSQIQLCEDAKLTGRAAEHRSAINEMARLESQ